MFAYEVQPKDHYGDFEIRDRKVENVKLAHHESESGEPCIVLEVSFGDGHCAAWELEFMTDEWKRLIESGFPGHQQD